MTESKHCQKPAVGQLLAAYELGILDPAEQRRFENHLQECPACLETLYESAPAAEIFRGDPTRCRKALQPQQRHVKQPGFFERLRAALNNLLTPRVLVPLTSVAVLTLVFFNYSPIGQPGIRTLASVDPLPWTRIDLRGTNNLPCDLLFAGGMEHYVAGCYDSAAVDLSAARRYATDDPTWPNRHQAALYHGLSLLLTNRPDASLAPLRTAAASPLPPIAERSRWYLAQAHLLLNDSATAESRLTSLLKSPVYGEQAATQLQNLRQICHNSGRD